MAKEKAVSDKDFCICDDCERKRADKERFLKLGEHDHTPASAYPARYIAPKEKP
jgi:hypothetical protein